jgi:DNA (cytosine-5)-methyltransferase 1
LWTGSCPCQPFSNAGQRKGTADERHLWPVFRDLISKCGPSIVFGEQVASADGRDWLASVRSEMEALGYAVGAADLCAAGIGAPHIRQRLYFVGMADADGGRCQQRDAGLRHLSIPDQNCKAGGMGNADSIGARGDGGAVRFPLISKDGQHVPQHADASGGLGRVADAGRPRGKWRENAGGSNSTQTPQWVESAGHDQPCSCDGDTHEADGFWGDADWLFCRDGKWRPVEPGTFPLANGIPGRVALLRGYGNAIVPQVAATFIRAALTT